MPKLCILHLIIIVGVLSDGRSVTASDADLEHQFADVRETLNEFCLECHSTEAKEGELDLQRFSSLQHVHEDLKPWQSMILYLSSMMTGSHNNDQLPVVMLGSGGGQIRTGRILDYLGKPNRKMCSLYLSMMDKVGIRLDQFGDSSERLSEIG